MFQKLVPFCTANRDKIIHIFQIGYAIWILFMLAATYINFTPSTLIAPLYEIGILLGKTAAIIFVLVTLPGILGRFGIRHPLITVGIMFRRHTGISMFLTGLAHGLIVYTLPNIAAGAPLFPRFGYELFGILTLAILTPLFLTSNLYSMQHLGKNWKRIHKLIYLAFWTMVLHIGLQGEVGWTLLIGGVGTLEILSLLYDWQKEAAKIAKAPVATPTPTPPAPPTSVPPSSSTA